MKVKVVIPIYKERLDELEVKMLSNNLAVLGSLEVAILIPEGLSTALIGQQIDISTCEIIEVSSQWLGSINGISGYNRMMLSADFYNIFNNYDYILICQSDVYIFRNEVIDWCNKGYDYVGAPWITHNRYNLPILKQYMALRKMLFSRRLKLLRQDYSNRVGNGGLSLRKVSTMVRCCNEYSQEIEHFLSQSHHKYNEDIFWALIPNGLSYPSVTEALKFSFDVRPCYCYKQTNGQLPMGAHGVTKSKYIKFWSGIIKELQ